MDKAWEMLTPEAKREERFNIWLSPAGTEFTSTAAAEGYQERVTRFIRTIKLEKTDRVPCVLPAAFFPAYYAGTTLMNVIDDHDELRRAWLTFLHEFETDAYHGPGNVFPGEALAGLDFRLYQWPGHGLSPDGLSYQYIEDEYMKVDEYDALIEDPSDFWTRVYLPRVFGALEPFRHLAPVTTVTEIPMGYLVPYIRKDVQEALRALATAGERMAAWLEAVNEVSLAAVSAGYPALFSGFAKAPFDILGDTMRGTRGIMLDLFQHPDQLVTAMERLVPLTVRSALGMVEASGVPTVMMPLHKGADGFMSGRQFEEFYWPTLKKVVLGLIDEGAVPVLFAEGSYDSRLEIVGDLPRASVIWYFDQTDMARAKQVLGADQCLAGNVPASLLHTGTVQEVKECCCSLIETCGRGGGYILTGGTAVDKCPPENLRAMMAAAKECGR